MSCREREFFVDNLLVRIHFIIVMIRRTGLAPWEFEKPFPVTLTSTVLPVRAPTLFNVLYQGVSNEYHATQRTID